VITAVTTCMGRREHLETTLPLMLEAFDRVVVVDWSCPQGSGEYAADMGASVAYQYGERYFDRCRARNYGARLVTSDYVAFVDADTLCMPGLRRELTSSVRSDRMVLASRTASDCDIPNLFGFLACPIGAFWGVGGYDESFIGWGHEDSHLRGKLFLEARLSPVRLSPMAIGAIAHGNELRGSNQERSIHETSPVNFKKLVDYFRSQGIDDWMKDPRTDAITYKPLPIG